jgi:ketosteroid isomerase-like protein
MLIKSFIAAILFAFLSACEADSSAQDAAVIAVAKAGYDAFATGDMEAWAATQAPDAQWEMPKGFPYGGSYVGPEQVIAEVFTPIGELWPDFKVEPVAFHASGNVVFIETKMTAGGVVSDSIHRAVINDGQYIAFQVYDDAGFMMAHAVGASSIGTQYFEDGSSQPLLAGSASNVQIWLDYIAAHNSRDFDTIAAMNTEDFRGVAPHGEVVEGIAAHTAFLQDWMAAENPRWEVWWAIANDGANADGAMEEWLATGNIVTTTGADGTESRAYETIDVLLEGGKIKALNVASQTMPE